MAGKRTAETHFHRSIRLTEWLSAMQNVMPCGAMGTDMLLHFRRLLCSELRLCAESECVTESTGECGTHFQRLIRLTDRLPVLQSVMPCGAMCGNGYARGCCTLHWISHGHTALHSGIHTPVFEGDDAAHGTGTGKDPDDDARRKLRSGHAMPCRIVFRHKKRQKTKMVF